uniref:Uncharacterized protein n=1 Tax=Arundo donax TaxID=35708 RepID=A0A0A9F303_ARUDO
MSHQFTSCHVSVQCVHIPHHAFPPSSRTCLLRSAKTVLPLSTNIRIFRILRKK